MTLPSMAPCAHDNVPHDCPMCKANERIRELSSENKKLKRTVRELRNKLSRTSRSLNRRIRDDFEQVDFGERR